MAVIYACAFYTERERIWTDKYLRYSERQFRYWDCNRGLSGCLKMGQPPLNNASKQVIKYTTIFLCWKKNDSRVDYIPRRSTVRLYSRSFLSAENDHDDDYDDDDDDDDDDEHPLVVVNNDPSHTTPMSIQMNSCIVFLYLAHKIWPTYSLLNVTIYCSTPHLRTTFIN